MAFEKAVALRENGRTWFNLGVVACAWATRRARSRRFERAAQFPDTKEQATKEIQKVKAGAGPRPAHRAPAYPAKSSAGGLDGLLDSCVQRQVASGSSRRSFERPSGPPQTTAP